MNAHEALAAYIGYGPDEHDAKFEQLLDAYRTEVLAEAEANLQEMFGMAPSAAKAPGIEFSIGVLQAMHYDAGEKTTAPAAAVTPACAKCHRPFDPTDSSYNGRAQFSVTPWCRACVDRCHVGGDGHECAACRAIENAAPVPAPVLQPRDQGLLDEIRYRGGIWHTARAEDLFKHLGIHHPERKAQHSLTRLHQVGHLVLLPGTEHGHRYQLAGGAS